MLFAKFATQFSINAGSRYFYRTPNSTFEDRKNREQIPVFKSFTRFAHDARKYRRYEFPSTNRLSDFFSRRRQPQYRVYDDFMKCRHYASKKSDNGGSRTPSGGSDKPSKQATVNKQPAKGKGKSSGDKSANKQTAKSSGDKSAAKQTPKSSGDKSAAKQTAKSPDKSAKSPKKSPKAPIKSAKSPNKSDKTPNKSDKTQPSDKRKIKPKKRCVCGNGKPKKKDKDKTTQTNPESKKSGKESKGSKKGLQLRTTQDEYDIQLNTEFAQMTSEKISVAIIGSGNWGTAIAKIIGENAKKLRDFNDRVNMWVHAEQVNGKSLTDIINETHENVKYLKGIKLPNNVFALTDVGETAKNAQILVFVLPHQFIPNVCESMKGKIKKDATAVSLIKGFGLRKDGGIELITRIIENHLNIPCSSLIGANIALGVAKGEFSESTLGCRDPRYAMKLRQIFQTDFFRISVVHKSDGVEICGALKNIVAIAVGFCDGMKLGNNTKAAVIRLGLMEMIHFIDEFFPGTDISVYFESCGIADLITTCFGGRNRSVSAAFVTQNKSFEELELEMLSGQKLQGPLTADEVNQFLKAKKSEHKYPLFTTVHLISTGKLKPQDLIKNIRKHPEHERSMKAYLKAYRASVKK